MLISWLGAASIRIATTPLQEEMVIITDPCAPHALGQKRGKITADAALVSTIRHPLHNALSEVRGKDAHAPFVLTTPGECELKGAMIYGIPAHGGKGESASPSTLFLIESEGIIILHIGYIGQRTLTDKQLTRFEHVDALCIPAGDPDGPTPAEAAEIVGQIEPRIVIPISYEPGKGKTKFHSVEKFIKELGLEADAPVTKIKITKKDLPAEETRLVLLTP